MKECDLKSLLRNFQSIQIQVQYLKENNKETEKYKEKIFIYNLLCSALDVLDEKERFIIETHIIKHYTWTETLDKWSLSFGLSYIRSDRTLKRMQNQALQKMIIFIESVSNAE